MILLIETSWNRGKPPDQNTAIVLHFDEVISVNLSPILSVGVVKRKCFRGVRMSIYETQKRGMGHGA
jgi:hypothetical protein